MRKIVSKYSSTPVHRNNVVAFFTPKTPREARKHEIIKEISQVLGLPIHYVKSKANTK